MSLHIETNLIESRALSMKTGRSVWLKLEALQTTGSFKIRGVGHASEIYVARGAKKLVSSSGGNAGLAVAYAGRLLGVPVTVVIPETTTERAKELLRLENAEVVVHGASWQEANEFAQSLLDSSTAFIHPFDDPLLWQGHATLVDEIHASGFKPDAVVLSVGGGGLLSGVIEGLHRNGWSDIPVFAVETQGAASFYEAVKRGSSVELDHISSVATSLGAKRVCEQAVNWSKQHRIHNVLVSDASALSACESFLADHRLLVEPACGASLALTYDDRPELNDFQKILIVVCGGVTATIEQIKLWQNAQL